MSARAWDRRRAKARPWPTPTGTWWIQDEIHEFTGTVHTRGQMIGWRPWLPEPERRIETARRRRLAGINRRWKRRHYVERRAGGFLVAGYGTHSVEFLAIAMRPVSAEWQQLIEQTIHDVLFYGSSVLSPPPLPPRMTGWSHPDADPLRDLREARRFVAAQAFQPDHSVYAETQQLISRATQPDPPKDLMERIGELLEMPDSMHWSPEDPTYG